MNFPFNTSHDFDRATEFSFLNHCNLSARFRLLNCSLLKFHFLCFFFFLFYCGSVSFEWEMRRSANGDSEPNGLKGKKKIIEILINLYFTIGRIGAESRKPNPKTNENKKWHRFYTIASHMHYYLCTLTI